MRSTRKPKNYLNEPTGISTALIFMAVVGIGVWAFLWLLGIIV